MKDLSILIVDDVEVNCTILHERISSWGIHTDYVLSGTEAIKALRKAKKSTKPYQIAIIDHKMPEMNGLDLAELIKSNPDISDTIMIMLTSVGDQFDSEIFLSKGYTAYHVKPITPSQLANTLENIWNTYLK